MTNAIVHGYENMSGFVTVCCAYSVTEIEITVSDYGRKESRISSRRAAPFYTSCADQERSGMGFTVMETFMDEVDVKSSVGMGTSYYAQKNIGVERTCSLIYYLQ